MHITTTASGMLPPSAQPQPDTSWDCETMNSGASASRRVPVYSPAYNGTHCANPQKDD